MSPKREVVGDDVKKILFFSHYYSISTKQFSICKNIQII
jgi:hypothetical protein